MPQVNFQIDGLLLKQAYLKYGKGNLSEILRKFLEVSVSSGIENIEELNNLYSELAIAEEETQKAEVKRDEIKSRIKIIEDKNKFEEEEQKQKLKAIYDQSIRDNLANIIKPPPNR